MDETQEHLLRRSSWGEEVSEPGGVRVTDRDEIPSQTRVSSGPVDPQWTPVVRLVPHVNSDPVVLSAVLLGPAVNV